jgi:hypothetical protein
VAYHAYRAFSALLFGKRTHKEGTYLAYLAFLAILFGMPAHEGGLITLISLFAHFYWANIRRCQPLQGNERAYGAFSGSGKTLAFEGHGLQPVHKWL